MQAFQARGLLAPELIQLDAHPADKAAAIAEAARLLVEAGCADPGYEASMARREAVANTFLGHGVVIPHGMVEDRALVRRDGIAVLQLRRGMAWNPGQTARLVVAIAARSDGHIAILRRLTRLIQDTARLDALCQTNDPAVLIRALTKDPAPAGAQAPATDLAETLPWTVPYPAGLHARPATRWVEMARALGVRLQVRHGGAIADPRNLLSLLQLGLKAGDAVVLSAEGEDAQASLAKFRAGIEGLAAQERADAARAAAREAAPVAGWQAPKAEAAVIGIGASPGLAIGRLHVLSAATPDVADMPAGLAADGEALQAALAGTRAELAGIAADTEKRLGRADAAIFLAQAELLADTDLITLTCQLLVQGHGVAWAWNDAVERTAARLAALGNPVLAGRAADLRDVGRRVLARLDPALGGNTLADLPAEPCILVAADLSPSDTAALDVSRVLGLAMAQGGPTSHSAILARTLGLPAMVAGGETLLAVASGATAILDGGTGRLYLDPGAEDLASARAHQAQAAAARAEAAAQRLLPASTVDGRRLAIGANINRPDQAPDALENGAEGVGLMRTEFLFLEAAASPSEDAQCAVYRGMIEALGGRDLIIRALDIGGDKQVAHLELPREENPFLGVRGARLLLRRPDLLEPQLRAIYRAATGHAGVSIMFPMITSVPEIVALRGTCERVRAALGAPVLPIGIMIEVPAAAIQAEALARHADFFSIGSNDLTQYTLAIDRQNPGLAGEADGLHPAVLRLIRSTVEGAAKHGRWVGVCGGMAGDPFAAGLLAGLGVDELSMTPRDIAGVKARLRGSDMAALRALAERALACATAAEVRALEAA
jgi:phosphocarrier protein FPr